MKSIIYIQCGLKTYSPKIVHCSLLQPGRFVHVKIVFEIIFPLFFNHTVIIACIYRLHYNMELRNTMIRFESVDRQKEKQLHNQ